VADRDLDAATATASEAQKLSSKETVVAVAIDIRDRESIRKALREVIKTYGGLDIVVNTRRFFRRRRMGELPTANGQQRWTSM